MNSLRLASVLVLLAGCGGKSHPVCPFETHLADPDGRGERCIDDASTCDAPSDCVADSECCTASCEDRDGSGVHACEQTCRSPECTEESCAAGWHCQAGVDACSAYCVPDDMPCEDGWILGDPTGTGSWQCIRAESSCTRRSDCPDSADGCCLGTCSDQGDSVFACGQDCSGEGARDGEDREAIWMCTTNEDCEMMMGQPGWTCEPTACWGNDCVPPVPECQGDQDCVLATDMNQCCMDCAQAYSLNEIGNDECLVVWTGGGGGDQEGAPEPPDDPPVCGSECYAIECPAVECVQPVRAGCSEGQCVPVY